MKYLVKTYSTDNNIIWLEHPKMGKCGIVDSVVILDEDGLQIDNYDTFAILERVFDQELDQDWEAGTTTLQLENGRVVFEGFGVTYKEE